MKHADKTKDRAAFAKKDEWAARIPAKLQAKWDAKLARSGFDDIEDRRTQRLRTSNTADRQRLRADRGGRIGGQDYFVAAGRWVWERDVGPVRVQLPGNWGPPRPRRWLVRLPNPTLARAWAMHAEGLEATEIARRLRMDGTKLHRWLRAERRVMMEHLHLVADEVRPPESLHAEELESFDYITDRGEPPEER